MQSAVVTLALLLSIVSVAANPAQQQEQAAFKRSDPSLIETEKTIRLVEFYHPT